MPKSGQMVYRLFMQFLVAFSQTMIARHLKSGADETIAYLPTIGFGEEETLTFTYGVLEIETDSARDFYTQLQNSARAELASMKSEPF